MDTRKEGRNWRKSGILGCVELELERKEGVIGGTERSWRDRDRREGEFRQGSEGEIVERQGSEGVRSRRKVKILEREGFEKKGKRNVLRKEGGASS